MIHPKDLFCTTDPGNPALAGLLQKTALSTIIMLQRVSQFSPFLPPPAMKAGFSGGLVVDYPNSSKAKKIFLCLMTGGGNQTLPKGLRPCLSFPIVTQSSCKRFLDLMPAFFQSSESLLYLDSPFLSSSAQVSVPRSDRVSRKATRSVSPIEKKRSGIIRAPSINRTSLGSWKRKSGG